MPAKRKKSPLKTLNDYYKRNIAVLQRLNLGDKALSAGYIMNAGGKL